MSQQLPPTQLYILVSINSNYVATGYAQNFGYF